MKNVETLDAIEAYPLHWPSWKPRSKTYKSAPFHEKQGYRNKPKSMTTARDELLSQLRLLGAKNVIISTNIPTRNDGLPYANRKPEEGDPGVAVYFSLDGQPKCFPNDKWNRVEDNIYGIAKTIGALRGIERWGTGDMVDAAFAGFKALPEQGTGESWWSYFKVDPKTATPHEIVRRFKKKAKQTHPDKPGGSAEAFRKAQQMKQQALSSIGD